MPYRHVVQYYETDRMGITHHSNYIRWMEEARVDFLRQIGWSYERLEARGLVSPVTALSCKYKATTTFADEVEIRVSVAEFRGVVLKFAYEMMKSDGTTVFEGASEHCFLDGDGRIIRLGREYPEFSSTLRALLPKDGERSPDPRKDGKGTEVAG